MSSHEIALSSLLDRKNNADFFKFWSASTGFLCGKKWCIEVFSDFFKDNICREKCNLDYSPCSGGGVGKMVTVSGLFVDFSDFFPFFASKQTAGKMS